MNVSATMIVAFACGLWLSISAVAFSTPTTTTRRFSSHFPQAKKECMDALVLTYLEINGYLISANGVTILVDPILEGPLDFGIPDLYKAKKKSLPATGLCESLPPVDCILITQGLDDHAHVRTLKKLSSNKDYIDIPIVAPPSARRALEKSGLMGKSNVRFLRHGQRTTIFPRDQMKPEGISICATTGALVGPPWQARENGYILRSKEAPSVYIEPHVEFSPRELMKEGPVDVVITPIVGQGLPAFDLVHGPQDTIRLLETLRPKFVIPMPNGNVQAEGIISPLVQTIGSIFEFRQRLKDSKLSTTKVMDLIPGQDYIVKI